MSYLLPLAYLCRDNLTDGVCCGRATFCWVMIKGRQRWDHSSRLGHRCAFSQVADTLSQLIHVRCPGCHKPTMAPGHSLRVKRSAGGGGLSTNHQSMADQSDDWQYTEVAGALFTNMSAEDILPSALLTIHFLIIFSLTWYNLILIINRN